MRKFHIIVFIIAAIIVAGYLWLRIWLKNEKPPASGVHAEQPIKEKTNPVLDIRPRLIERLQELVKKGSDGLYDLSIEKIEPDLLKSTVEVLNARLVPDKQGLAELEKRKKAPDDVFEIFSPALYITGIGVEDLLKKDVINLKTIVLTDPVIKVYHQEKDYNKSEPDSSSTIYQKLIGQLKKISVDDIRIKNATVVTQNRHSNNPTNFKNVSIHMKDLLIDSATQYDKDRFLFARFAELNFKNLTVPTKDKLYWLNAGAVSISATNKMLTASSVSLKPRGTKKEFRKKLKHRQVMYTVAIPQVQFTTVNWWNLFNGEGLEGEDLNINDAKCTIYMDRSLPQAKKNPHDFPHQLLSSVSAPVYIKRLKLNRASVVYQEYNPLSKNTGTIHLGSVNARITNVTNMPEVIRRNNKTSFITSTVFMNKAKLKTNIQFDLSKLKTGAFTARIEMDPLTKETLNSIAEPLGLFTIKTGSLQKASAFIKGDNYSAAGRVTVLYDDLHITPLKPEPVDTTDLKKKHLVSFIANTFLIKDENPSKGEEPRTPDAFYKRVEGSDLFNLVWKTMLVGTLKTIGINEKYATPPAQ